MKAIKILALMGSRSLFGAERANVDLLWRMQQRGAEVLCLVRHEDWPENIAMRAALTARGLAWEPAPFPDYPSIRYWRYWLRVAIETPWRYWRLNRSAEQAILRRGFTHLHLFNPFQAASLRRAITRTNIPVVYRCGEVPVSHNAFFRTIWGWLAQRITKFVAESDFLKQLLLDMDVEESKIVVVRTPAPARSVTTISSNPLFHSPRKSLRFAYLGQISEFKGLRVLVAAFRVVLSEFPDAQLCIAGPIESAFAKALVAECEPFIQAGSIAFLGSIDDVDAYLLACDVHLAPSLNPEGYGLVVVEAKAAGLPSIVFAEGGLAELVVDEQEGIALTEKSPRALADAVLTYCRDPARAKADGGRARASLTNRLKVHQHDDAWWKVYVETAADGSRQTHGDRR